MTKVIDKKEKTKQQFLLWFCIFTVGSGNDFRWLFAFPNSGKVSNRAVFTRTCLLKSFNSSYLL